MAEPVKSVVNAQAPAFIKDWIQMVGSHESPYLYTRWAAAAAVAAMVGRRVFCRFGGNELYPNLYTILVGDPACKKSTVVRTARRILQRAGYVHFGPEHINRTALLEMLASKKHTKLERYNNGVAPRRFLKSANAVVDRMSPDGKRHMQSSVTAMTDTGVIPKGMSGTQAAILAMLSSKRQAAQESEVQERAALRSEQYDLDMDSYSEVVLLAEELVDLMPKGAGMDDVLRLLNTMWDCPVDYLAPGNTKRDVYITNPVINMLAAVTHEGLTNMLESRQLNQGILTRRILVYAQPSGRVLSPLHLWYDPVIEDRLVDVLVRAGNMSGELVFSEQAEQLLTLIRKYNPRIQDTRLTNWGNRREAQLAKLSMLAAIMRGSYEITLDDVVYSNTLLTFTEFHMPDALGEFGYSKSTSLMQVVVHAIKNAAGGIISTDALWAAVHMHVPTAEELGKILGQLESVHIIQRVRPQGQTIAHFTLKERNLTALAPLHGKLVNPSLMQEWLDLIGN